MWPFVFKRLSKAVMSKLRDFFCCFEAPNIFLVKLFGIRGAEGFLCVTHKKERHFEKNIHLKGLKRCEARIEQGGRHTPDYENRVCWFSLLLYPRFSSWHTHLFIHSWEIRIWSTCSTKLKMTHFLFWVLSRMRKSWIKEPRKKPSGSLFFFFFSTMTKLSLQMSHNKSSVWVWLPKACHFVKHWLDWHWLQPTLGKSKSLRWMLREASKVGEWLM